MHLEVAAERAAQHGQDHVVHRAPGLGPDAADFGERELAHGELAPALEGLVEGRPLDGNDHVGQRCLEGAQDSPRPVAAGKRLIPERHLQARELLQAVGNVVEERVDQPDKGRGLRLQLRPLAHHRRRRVGRDVEDDHQEFDAGDAVDQAVVHLGQEGRVATFQAADQVDLP